MLEPAAERCELDAILTRLETAVGALAHAIDKLNRQPEKGQSKKLEISVCVTESPSLSMNQEPSAPTEAGNRKQKLEGLAGHLVQLEDRAGCLSPGPG